MELYNFSITSCNINGFESIIPLINITVIFIPNIPQTFKRTINTNKLIQLIGSEFSFCHLCHTKKCMFKVPTRLVTYFDTSSDPSRTRMRLLFIFPNLCPTSTTRIRKLVNVNTA